MISDQYRDSLRFACPISGVPCHPFVMVLIVSNLSTSSLASIGLTALLQDPPHKNTAHTQAHTQKRKMLTIV